MLDYIFLVLTDKSCKIDSVKKRPATIARRQSNSYSTISSFLTTNSTSSLGS